MSLELTLRLLEIGLGVALLQRAAEHMVGRDTVLFALQIMAATALLVGVARTPAVLALWVLGLWQLHRFHGPYNGGSDKMIMLALTALGLAHLWPDWADLAVAYLAVQVILSYLVSGWIKIVSPDWRSGRALQRVFAQSNYPASAALRGWADHPRLLLMASWSVILFELAFPLGLLRPELLYLALALAAVFHLANACLLGLNRFFWAWISTYPAVIWLQGQLIA